MHVVLGNHEAMNLLGDLRYVVAAEYAAYAADEPAELREQASKDWLAHGGTEADFAKRFPPGYFGQRALLAPRGTYGAWLLTLPVAIAINDTLFMHGGASSTLAGLSLANLNVRYRTALVEHLQASETLRNAGLIEPGDAFNDWARVAAERLPRSRRAVRRARRIWPQPSRALRTQIATRCSMWTAPTGTAARRSVPKSPSATCCNRSSTDSGCAGS
jgi:hypothetical protein